MAGRQRRAGDRARERGLPTPRERRGRPKKGEIEKGGQRESREGGGGIITNLNFQLIQNHHDVVDDDVYLCPESAYKPIECSVNQRVATAR